MLINRFLPYDNRRMRLDRILIKNGSNFKINNIEFFANKKIEGSSYLFPSDHFGLTA